jgi:hypothetical protein
VPVFRQEVWLEIQRDRAAEDGSGASDAEAVTDALEKLKSDE